MDAKAPAPTVDSNAKVPVPGPADEPAGEDWLLWFDRGGQWITQWISVGPDRSTPVAERKALVLSDGTRLWVVERKDAEVDVVDCECFEREGVESGCKPSARLTTPGLHAIELGNGTELVVRAPSTERVVGGDIGLSLEVQGGVGPRLAFEWGDSGYYCGAHGSYESSFVLFDLSTGKEVEAPFAAVAEALPAEVRTTAAKEIHQLLDECEGDDGPSLQEVLSERMGLTSLHMGVAAGEPRLTWHFEAETYYACSSDYAAHGDGASGLVPGAAPLSLHVLPEGVVHALVTLRDVPTVGWARLSLFGAARQAALEAFEQAPEGPWPSGSSSERPIAAVTAVTAAGDEAGAKAKLEEGRRLTRAKDYAAAIAAYDAAIALDASLARVWSERGYAKLLMGDLAGAQADLEAALPLDDGAAFRAAVHYNLGLVAEKRGDARGARTAFETSLGLRDNEAVRKALARVK